MPNVVHSYASGSVCVWVWVWMAEWPFSDKQLLNYHSPILEKSVKWPNAIMPFDQLYPNLMNGNSATVLLPNYHSAVQTQTLTQPEVFRKHRMCMFYSTQLQWWSSLLSYIYWCFACTILDPGRGNRIICYEGKSCRNYILISFILTRIPPTEETPSLCFYELLISSPIKSRWQ